MATRTVKERANDLMFKKIIDVAIEYSNTGKIDESNMIWLWQTSMIEYFLGTLVNWGTLTTEEISKAKDLING